MLIDHVPRRANVEAKTMAQLSSTDFLIGQLNKEKKDDSNSIPENF